MNNPQLILASASPRRRELLEQIGVRFRVVTVDIDEGSRPGESPQALVQRLAVAKASTAAAQTGHELPVLGADTLVVIDDRILGKPVDQSDGLAMLASLQGRAHQVLTAVALFASGHHACRVSVSRVHMREMSEAQRKVYWRSGEGRDKAGAYAIQGKGALYITHLEGSYSGVVGLPLFETAELLAMAGIHPLEDP